MNKETTCLFCGEAKELYSLMGFTVKDVGKLYFCGQCVPKLAYHIIVVCKKCKNIYFVNTDIKSEFDKNGNPLLRISKVCVNCS